MMNATKIPVPDSVTLKLMSCGERQRVFCDACEPFLTRMVGLLTEQCVDAVWRHSERYWCLLRQDWDDFYNILLETANQCGVTVNLELIE